MKEFLRQNIVSVIAFTLIVGGAYVTLNDLKGNTVSKDVYEAEKKLWQQEIMDLKKDNQEHTKLLNQIVTDVAVISTDVKHILDNVDPN